MVTLMASPRLGSAGHHSCVTNLILITKKTHTFRSRNMLCKWRYEKWAISWKRNKTAKEQDCQKILFGFGHCPHVFWTIFLKQLLAILPLIALSDSFGNLTQNLTVPQRLANLFAKESTVRCCCLRSSTNSFVFNHLCGICQRIIV